MSGRPSAPNLTAPAYTVLEHAPDTYYPAGPNPWNGNPTKTDLPGRTSVGFAPNQGNAAQYHNFLHNAWSEGLADAKAYADSLRGEVEDAFATVLDFVGQSPALNFPVAATAALAKHVKYSPATRTWYAVGGSNDQFVRTRDPYVWPGTTEFTFGLPWTLVAWDFAVDTGGNLFVVTTGSDFGWEYNAGTSSWTKVSGSFGTDLLYASVAHEATTGLFVVAGPISGTGVPRFSTSPDRTTWTTRTAPAGWPTSTTAIVTLTAANGIVVAQATDGTNLYLARSTDGGVTWSATTTIALGFTASYSAGTRQTAPVWTGSKWIVVARNTSTPRTKVFASEDGASWAQVSDLSTVGIQHLAAVGELICAVSGNEPVVSFDGGATWRWGTRRLAGTVTAVAASPCQFMLACNGSVYPSLAAGTGVSAAT